MEQAFTDLSALMQSAATMVALAERFRGVMAGGEAAGAHGPGKSERGRTADALGFTT
jgi:ESCRT-II complex subunit VPS36